MENLEQRLEKKLNEVNSFRKSLKNFKGTTTYFEGKNLKSERKYKVLKTLTSLLESVDIFVNVASSTTSVTSSVTAFGPIVVPISTGIAYALSVGNKVLHKIIMNNYHWYKKKQNEKDQQTFETFDQFYRKSL